MLKGAPNFLANC